MKEVTEDRGQCPAMAIAAVMDIEKRNKANKPNFTAAQIAVAEQVRTLAIEAHKDGGKVYPINYRVKELTVKVGGARERDKLSAGWPALEAYCTKHNVVKKVTSATGSWIYVIK